MTTSAQSFRPDDIEFRNHFRKLKARLDIEGLVVAQQLGMNQLFTDVMQGPPLLVEWPDANNPNNPNPTISGFLRTKEKTDGLILPGANFKQVIPAKLHDGIQTLRDKIDAVQIYNADCPVVIISDIRGRINAVLHGAVECLFSMPDKDLNGGGESLFINTAKHLQNTYGINPEELEVTIMGGAGPCCYGHGAESTGEYLKHLELMEEYEKATAGIKSIVKRGGINKGPRKGGHSIDINELLRRQAEAIGVKTEHICISDDCTCCAGRSADGKNGKFFSNIYKSDKEDKRRNAVTVKPKRSLWERFKRLFRKKSPK